MRVPAARAWAGPSDDARNDLVALGGPVGDDRPVHGGRVGELQHGGVGVVLAGGDGNELELRAALALGGLDVDTGVRDGRTGELDGVFTALPDGRGDAVGAGAEGDARGVDVQVAGDAGLGLGGDEVVADRPGFPGNREVQVVGAAGLPVAALVAVAGLALVTGAAAGGAVGGQAVADRGTTVGGASLLPPSTEEEAAEGTEEAPVSVASAVPQAVVAAARAVTAAAARTRRVERAASRERIMISNGVVAVLPADNETLEPSRS